MVISILFFFFFNHLILSDENICVRVSIVGLWAFLGGDDPALLYPALISSIPRRLVHTVPRLWGRSVQECTNNPNVFRHTLGLLVGLRAQQGCCSPLVPIIHPAAAAYYTCLWGCTPCRGGIVPQIKLHTQCQGCTPAGSVIHPRCAGCTPGYGIAYPGGVAARPVVRLYTS